MACRVLELINQRRWAPGWRRARWLALDAWHMNMLGGFARNEEIPV